LFNVFKECHMKTFSIEELRTIAKTLFTKAVSAADPYRRLKEVLEIEKSRLRVVRPEGLPIEFDLNNFSNIYLIGAGKASAPMAQAIEEVFGDRITRGVITTKTGHALPLNRTEIIEASHPIPDQKGIAGAEKMVQLLKDSGPRDLVLFLLSGGGSALILSDVVGDPLDSIGSGPTVPDTSTFEEAWEILKKYNLVNEVAPSVYRHLLFGKEGKIGETPKPGDPSFERVYNMLIGSNLLALQTAARESRSLGFNTLILSSSIVGETKEAARFHAAIVREVAQHGNPIPKPACLISGGETTVTIRGNGLGGRNQEFALAGALEIEGIEKVVLLSGGTDGTDGPTDAAGAISDSTTVKRARGIGLDPRAYLENNDAYPLFKKLGDLLMTGPTRTNVMDVRIILVD
jgi:glycerate 2-kinase